MEIISNASGYAVLTTKNYTFYYGYEAIDENGEWCFKATTKNGGQVIIPFSKLGIRDQFDCGACLLAGIGQLLDEKLIIVDE